MRAKVCQLIVCLWPKHFNEVQSNSWTRKMILRKNIFYIPRVISGTCMMLILPSSVPAMIWFSSKNLTTLTAACNLKWFKMFLPLKSINLTAPDSPPVTTTLPKVPTSSSFISLVSVHRILRLDSVISTVLTLSDSSITGSKVFCFPQLHKRNVPSLKKKISKILSPWNYKKQFLKNSLAYWNNIHSSVNNRSLCHCCWMTSQSNWTGSIFSWPNLKSHIGTRCQSDYSRRK